MLYPRRSRRQDRRSEPRRRRRSRACGAAASAEEGWAERVACIPRSHRRAAQRRMSAEMARDGARRICRARDLRHPCTAPHGPCLAGGPIWGVIKLGAGQTFRHEHNTGRRNVRNRPVGGSSRDREAAAAHSPSHASVFSSLRAPPDRRQAVPPSSRCRFTRRMHARGSGDLASPAFGRRTHPSVRLATPTSDAYSITSLPDIRRARLTQSRVFCLVTNH